MFNLKHQEEVLKSLSIGQLIFTLMSVLNEVRRRDLHKDTNLGVVATLEAYAAEMKETSP